MPANTIICTLGVIFFLPHSSLNVYPIRKIQVLKFNMAENYYKTQTFLGPQQF